MIVNLNGLIQSKTPPECVIDVGGVGYLVMVSMITFFELPDVGAKLNLKVHPIYREDSQQLFGFIDEEERALFKLLIKTNGIGPKSAIGILSNARPFEVVTLVQNQDVVGLSKMPGIGKKTAERLIVELKEKLKTLPDFNYQQEKQQTKESAVNPAIQSAISIEDDAKAALLSLGYTKASANALINKIYEPGLTVEALLRLALKQGA